MTLGKKPFENIVGKRENAGNQHFLLLPKCLLSISNTNFHLDYMYIEMSSANTFKLDWSQFLSLGYRVNSTKHQNFSPVQIESRGQNKSNL